MMKRENIIQLLTINQENGIIKIKIGFTTIKINCSKLDWNNISTKLLKMLGNKISIDN